MRKTPIDDHIMVSVKSDIARAIKVASRPGVSVRMVRLPHTILAPAIDAVTASNPYSPFSPTICGIPCDFSTDDGIDIVTVTDTSDTTGVRILDHTGKPANKAA